MIEHRHVMIDTSDLDEASRVLQELADQFHGAGVDTSGSRLRIELIFSHVDDESNVIAFPAPQHEPPQDAA